MSSKATDKTERCPNCRSTNTCPLLFGKPAMTAELIRRLDAGEVHLAGCECTPDGPTSYCNDCNTQF